MSERFTQDRDPPFEKRYAVGVPEMHSNHVQKMSPWFETREAAEEVAASLIKSGTVEVVAIIWTYWQED